ncbi:MAG: GyrI-like domain-containing protein [Planctomycetota bacterium]|nr:GyrI-like domain-containing protein [Planctomycetota bacterium]
MSAAAKLDLYKEHKAEYAARQKPSIVAVKKAAYLAVSGSGAPGGEEFQAKIGALYSMAFTVKMTWKFDGRGDYTICKLECQWWADDESVPFSARSPDEWRWRLLIRTPGFIKKRELANARKVLAARGKGEGTDDVQLASLVEGRCVQALHVGPYEREHETIALMRDFATREGLEFHGRHHEVYLSDPRRVPAERLKTILRLPVRKKRE